MEVIKAIRSILVAESDVTDITDTRIYAYAAPQDAAAPFVVASVVYVRPSDCKNGPSTVDTFRVQIDSTTKTATDSATLDRAVRAALDRVGKGTVSGVSIQGIRFDTSLMQFDDERQLRTISSDYDVRVDRSNVYPGIPGIAGLEFFVSDAAAIAAGYSVGDYYLIAVGSDVGPAGLIKRIV